MSNGFDKITEEGKSFTVLNGSDSRPTNDDGKVRERKQTNKSIYVYV